MFAYPATVAQRKRASLNEFMVIHYLSCTFEALLEVQMSCERQGQVVIRSMEGEMKRTSEMQTQKDQMRGKKE